MSLRDLLYRCPHCGQDPVEGSKDRVRCPKCGTIYERDGASAMLRVRTAGRSGELVPAHRLTDSIRDLGGPFPAARSEDGALRYESEVRVRRSTREEAVRYRGRLMGFTEQLGTARPAVLRIVDDVLEMLEPDGTGPTSTWNVMDLRAVQASSSSLQIYTDARELVHFRFLDASPLRWEALLHAALRRAYEEAGKGEIVEFQPRITIR